MYWPEHADVPLWPFLAAASGSAGDVVASRNAHGPFFRNRVTPTDPGTPRQTTVRNHWRNIHGTYEGRTTDAQKAAWDVYAASVPVRNRLGDLIHLTGRQWFTKINYPRMTAPLAFILSPPTDLSRAWTSPLVFKFTRTPSLVSISRPVNDDWWPEAGAVYYHSVTTDYPPTITSKKPPWIYLGFKAAVSPAVVTFPLPTTPTAGNRIFTRYKFQRADGRITEWMYSSGIVTAT